MRISWITAAAILISTQATAGLEQDLQSCSAKTDKLDRLICYDRVAASVKAHPKPPVAYRRVLQQPLQRLQPRVWPQRLKLNL